MASKARLFDDAWCFDRILSEDDPRRQKAWGRRVRGFDQVTWDAKAVEIVYQGDAAKFGQNADLRRLLLATEGSLVEASPYDQMWGIGLGAEDPRAKDRATWLGQNLLGEVLTTLRGALRAIPDDLTEYL